MRVLQKVVGNLILGREAVATRRETQARQCIPRRRKETERVPAVAPRVSDSLVRIENQKRKATFPQIVAHAEAGLSSSDNNCLDARYVSTIMHSSPPRRFFRIRFARVRIGASECPRIGRSTHFSRASGMGNFMQALQS